MFDANLCFFSYFVNFELTSWRSCFPWVNVCHYIRFRSLQSFLIVASLAPKSFLCQLSTKSLIPAWSFIFLARNLIIFLLTNSMVLSSSWVISSYKTQHPIGPLSKQENACLNLKHNTRITRTKARFIGPTQQA